ncbi:bifunctional protein FolD protein [Clostridium acetireducens DSM 10703]|jgi:methylenetetrahydrofolate dehydrogenase (NADP+)/methenyltetrahydrofolate cyclohydrolase|uniref:Bifunctional protein FolD n=1 Tax=Clostridium acetireducens DSM 10703 TaxID=1121290 RepID=A0A1E8F1S1_9CLOT|nr:tetrahydrofolate dehydrogenase/cyclohydrolase catalytic domain-containing protein [Clostridium acetireducens]OFI07597.1 bifunctional protein FolD protein [Clostridium acetireducens DSM 10703]
MGTIIKGKEIANKYKKEISDFVENRKKEFKRVPCISTILVGNDAGSMLYAKNQKRICEQLGLKYILNTFEENTKEKEIIDNIERLNSDNNVDGIILMLPLPKHLNEKYITSKISYKKDIDGLTDINTGMFYKGEKCFIPCTPKGIVKLIESTGINIEGKNAVVVGRSNIVGKPIAHLLLNKNATVTICHSKTKNLKEVCKSADILIAAIGKPNFINEEFVKKGAVVIDVGTNRVEGKVVGDVYFEKVINKADYVTPVPGGVGAMTTTMLMLNTCEALNRNVY